LALMATLYLDHAATTPLRPEARRAMAPYLGEVFGNPSGLHGVSRRVKTALEEAREEVAAIVGAAHPLEIVFTGGGTEANNLAVAGAALAGGGRRGVVTTAIEHEAVLAPAGFVGSLGCPLSVVGVDEAGVVEAGAVGDAVDASTGIVSVMAANNETGVRQPVRKVAEEVKSRRPDVLVHSDAVQAFVSEEITVAELGVDLLSLAAHKLGGPQGVGVLYVRRGVELEPVIHGGGQELGRRSGTHNVAGIVGTAAAMSAAARDRDGFRRRVAAIRDAFEDELVRLVPEVVFTTGRDGRLVQHSHFRIPGTRAETLLIKLDSLGVAASAGSACHSGAIDPSHVLSAMGVHPEAAAESVRVTFGWTSSDDDAGAAARAVAGAVA
jgi:cysteine desulfurase